MARFGSFSPFCSSPSPSSFNTPSTNLSTNALLPHCNLFFRSLLKVTDPPALTTLLPFEYVVGQDGLGGSITGETNQEDLIARRAVTRAGTGVGVRCDVGRMGQEGSLGDIAQLITSVICFLFVVFLIYRTSIRRAAVGRVEFRYFLTLFALTLPLQIVTTANVLTQGSSALAVLSAIHIGLIAGMMWILVGNAIVATQIVADGSPSALIPLTLILILISGITTYLALDQAFGISSLFQLENGSRSAGELRNIALWVLGLMWPYLASVIYLVTMLYITFSILRETRPCLYFILAFLLFGASQAVLLLASEPMCVASGGKVTSSFLATLLQTASVATLYYAWTSITEADWDEPDFYQEYPMSNKY